MKCPKCNFENENTNLFCTNCNYKLTNNEENINNIELPKEENYNNSNNNEKENNNAINKIHQVITTLLTFVALSVIYFYIFGIICGLIIPIIGWAIALAYGIYIAPIISLFTIKSVVAKIKKILNTKKIGSRILITCIFWIALYFILISIFFKLHHNFFENFSYDKANLIIQFSSIIISFILSKLYVNLLSKN